MATPQDLQDLIRLFTVGRKIPMMQAMAQIKALQAVELRSIKQIAESALETVQSAIKDEKTAKSLQNACKAALKREASSGTKRGAPSSPAHPAKRAKNAFMNVPVEMTPQEFESSLELPIIMDEDKIRQTVVEMNRAPLVLAFAVELLRYTMPEQPPSSRLSLAQAVVSANSRSKAVSLGFQKGPSADEEGWGEGQPRVKVMGREVAVLKRGGYEWKGEENVGGDAAATSGGSAVTTESASAEKAQTQSPLSVAAPATPKPVWATSAPISLKDSKFIARAIHLSSPSERGTLMKSLFNAQPQLRSASHNAWAYRLRPSEGSMSNRPREESFDDGETGCGDLMLRIMREINAVDTLVVLTRWFGGTMLGPDRWRLMRNVVTSALTEQFRKSGAEVSLGGEAVWGLDLEAAKNKATVGGYGSGTKLHATTGVVGMQIHRPEAARGYLLKSIAMKDEATSSSPARRKSMHKTHKMREAEREEALGLLLGALRMLFDSWADDLDTAELDRRAWGWYCAVRPDVENGVAGWGSKGAVRLDSILDLRRPERK
ncbi:protein impact [Cladorrhinum samala]|uniref:Protein impact n=1 Tax=Cladorrhinum samala TaxID=585594 RepID=A0AAV9HX97_9PEZI|nr:protein impact [Cladorrhinum samala]